MLVTELELPIINTLAVRMLTQYPEQWVLLRERPEELAPTVTDEALRYEPITRCATSRSHRSPRA
jgi:cytochrome P450